MVLGWEIKTPEEWTEVSLLWDPEHGRSFWFVVGWPFIKALFTLINGVVGFWFFEENVMLGKWY